MPNERSLRSPGLSWTRASTNPATPHPGQIDLWTINLERPTEDVVRAARLLSAEEVARAERYRFDRHRARFILGRAGLREIIAGYAGRAPADLRLGAETTGRPFLIDGGGLVFSYSKAGALAVLAVSRDGRIGVDIEEVTEKPDLPLIVEDQYSPGERLQLGRLPEDQRLEAFYRGWTAKEALVKATGEGLTSQLPQITVELQPDRPARLVDGPWPYEAHVWGLAAFAVAPGILGAAALDRPIEAVRGIVR